MLITFSHSRAIFASVAFLQALVPPGMKEGRRCFRKHSSVYVSVELGGNLVKKPGIRCRVLTQLLEDVKIEGGEVAAAP